MRKKIQFVNKLTIGLAILVASTAFQVSAMERFTEAEIQASPYFCLLYTSPSPRDS